MPALSNKVNLNTALKEGGAQSTAGLSRQRIRGALVVAQVALSFMLLIGAGLMIRSLIKLQQVNAGFDPEKVMVMRLSPNWSKYTTGEQYKDLSLRAVEKAKTMPGVVSAAMATTYPLNPFGITNGPFNRNFVIEGHPVAESELAPQADFRAVSPDYFQTIHMPLVKGRFFTEADSDNTLPVAVINQSLARHRWKDEDPVGRKISFNRGDTWITVIGVVGDSRNYGLDQEAMDEIYRPIAQANGGGYLLVRTAAEPLSLARQIRGAIHELDAEIAIDHVRTLAEARNEALASPRLTTLLLGLFALVALAITSAGVGGVIALAVSQRTHEIGIRMALGATRGKVLWMILRQGLSLAGAGLLVGVAGSLVLTRLMSTLLFGVEPTDVLTFLGVSVVIMAVAALACFVPARRATGIDPISALRSE
jgi:putative ABC transport system permease protein